MCVRARAWGGGSMYVNITEINTFLQDIKFAVHAHPSLSEVLDEVFKSAKACISC